MKRIRFTKSAFSFNRFEVYTMEDEEAEMYISMGVGVEIDDENPTVMPKTRGPKKKPKENIQEPVKDLVIEESIEPEADADNGM